MNKYVFWAVMTVGASALAIIGLDDIFEFFQTWGWVPRSVQDLNFFELIVFPLFYGLIKLRNIKTQKQLEIDQIDQGRQLGSALCQRIYLSIYDSGLLLHWINTGRYTTEEMSTVCGSEYAAKALVDDCDHALSVKTMICPILSVRRSFSAVLSLVAKHTSHLQQCSGNKKTFIIVPAIEDVAQILTIRFFEIPPAMLLLFLDDTYLDDMHTSRIVQSYRYVALRVLAQQVLFHSGEAPAWDAYVPNPTFAVCDIPHALEADEIDWWDVRWNIAPRVRYSIPEIEAKKNALSAYIIKRRNDTKRKMDAAHPVGRDRVTLSDLDIVNENIKMIPSASWF